jgi:hypothetical protein
LDRLSPKELTPNLFQLPRFKRRNISTELTNNRWIRNLGEINSAFLMEELILLFMAISDVHLNDQPDEIIWKWTSNGEYSSRLGI